MKKRIGIILIIWLIIGSLPIAYAEDFDGLIVQEVQVSCVTAEGLIKLIQKNISIQPGEVFSQEKIRENIRKIYALKRFSQITVEGELVEGGVRLSFCPEQIKTIGKIQITGNKTILEETIKNVLGLKVGDRVPLNGKKEIIQRVLKLYRDQGYHQVRVDINPIEEPGFEQVILAVDIQEGTPSKIGKITFQGNTIFSEKELIKASKLKSGMKFTLEVLEKAGDLIKEFYAKEGYLNLQLTGQDIKYNYNTGEADLQLTIVEGQPTRVEFEDNARISTKKLQKVVDIFSKRSIKEEILLENVKKLIEYYKDNGFYFVNVSYRQTQEADAAVITFVIDEGAQVRVQQITIEGNQAINTKQIRKEMLTEEKGIFSKGLYREKVFQDDLLAIKALYQQQGYLEADIISVSKEFSLDSTNVSIHLVIREGVQTRVEQIRIVGEQDEAVQKKIYNQLLFKENDPLDVDKVTQSIDIIREFYANQGYIKADVDVMTEFSEDNSRASLNFILNRGKQFFIGKISIQGVIRTKKEFITRELKVQEGDVYNPEKIRETVRRLLQLGFYDTVTFRRLDPKSDNPVQDMLLAVTETSAKDVELGIGYSTETDLKGFVEYSDKNVLNLGSRGTARIELSVERPKVTLQYLHPHLFIQDTSLVVSVFDKIQKDNESFDLETQGGRLALQYNFTKELFASLGYYFEQNNPSNVKQAATLSKIDTDVLNLGGVDAQLSWDIRDDIVQTKKGGFNQIYLRTANGELGSNINFYELNAQSSWYLNPFWNYVLAFSLNGKLIEPFASSNYVPIYTRYFLGGESSVRGYKRSEIGPTGEDEAGKTGKIGGNRLISCNVEFRFPIYSALGGVIFFDSGANWLDEEGFDSKHIRETLGAGLRVATPVGPLRFDYGWKLDRQPGESAGEYYITIGSAF